MSAAAFNPGIPPLVKNKRAAKQGNVNMQPLSDFVIGGVVMRKYINKNPIMHVQKFPGEFRGKQGVIHSDFAENMMV